MKYGIAKLVMVGLLGFFAMITLTLFLMQTMVSMV